MSYETDRPKSELERLKWEVNRKVEWEDHKRELREMSGRIDRIDSELRRVEFETQQKFESLNNLLNEHGIIN